MNSGVGQVLLTDKICLPLNSILKDINLQSMACYILQLATVYMNKIINITCVTRTLITTEISFLDLRIVGFVLHSVRQLKKQRHYFLQCNLPGDTYETPMWP